MELARNTLEGTLAEEPAAESSALVRAIPLPDPPKAAEPEAPLPEHIEQIQFALELSVPVPSFTLRRLQALTAGEVLSTEQPSTRELVLTAGGERLLLVELEAVELQLAARVKRLL